MNKIKKSTTKQHSAYMLAYYRKITEGMQVKISIEKDDSEDRWISGIVKYVEPQTSEANSEGVVKVRLTAGIIGYVKDVVEKLDEKELKEMIREGESSRIEFKETFRVDTSNNQKLDCLRYEVAKAIAAFMNTRGGFVLIGVSDLKHIVGLLPDYQLLNLKRDTQTKQDKFKQEIRSYIKEKFCDDALIPYYDIAIRSINGTEICVIDVKHPPWPVFVSEQVWYCKCSNRNQTKSTRQNFYIRNDSGSSALRGKAIIEYWVNRFSDTNGGFE